MLVQIFLISWLTLFKSTKSEKISTKNLNHRHLHSLPLTTESHVSSWGYPTNILLRGHGRYCSSHPRPPSPPGAAGPRNRCLCGLPRAAVCCLGSPRPSHGQNPTERREKNSEKILGTSKVKDLEILASQKSSLNFRKNVLLRMFWCHRIGWKGHVNLEKTVAFGFWQSRCHGS